MSKDLTEFVTVLKSDGYKVYTNARNLLLTEVYFCKENKIGMAYIEELSCMTIFSTVHKPCAKYGGGIRVFKVEKPLLEQAQKTLVAYDNKEGVEKYSSWEEFREGTKFLMLRPL